MGERTLHLLVLVSSVLWLGAGVVLYSPFFGTTTEIPAMLFLIENLSQIEVQTIHPLEGRPESGRIC